jgi:hypothetical protein
MQDEITRGKRVVLSKRDRLDRWNDQETREELREMWEKLEGNNGTRKVQKLVCGKHL